MFLMSQISGISIAGFVILALFVLLGLKKGFLRMLLTVLAIGLSIAAGSLAVKPIYNALAKKDFFGQEWLEGALSGIVMGGTVVGGVPTFELGYTFEGNTYTQTVCVGSELSVSGSTYYSLTLRDIGGNSLPSTISVYPVDFELKDGVTAYLNAWNEDGDITVNGKVLKAEERAQITYTDNLSVIISMIGDMIDIVTYALVAFTALSLVVSTVMIAIITYVSVIERIYQVSNLAAFPDKRPLYFRNNKIIGGNQP